MSPQTPLCSSGSSARRRRLLMIRQGSEEGVLEQARFVVVENWFDELERLVPTP